MRPARRFPTPHALVLVLALAVVAMSFGSASAADRALVRVWFDGSDGAAFLAAHPDLDVVTVKRGVAAEVIATPADMAVLRASGLRLEVVHEDLVRHYADRIVDKSSGFGGWHTYSESMAFLDDLRAAYPHVISEKWSIGQSHEGRDIWAVRISDNPDTDEAGEPEILLDTMHHAREIMSGEFGLMFAEHLCAGYGSDPVVTWLVDEREFYLVSIVNPDGVVYNEQTDPAGGGLWRKNRRDNGDGTFGVDPNRNYPFAWVGPGSSTETGSEVYRGPAPGSEPEVQALMAFIDSHEFVVQQTLHTYSNLTLYPWAYTSDAAPDAATFVHMGDIMTRFNGYEAGQPPDVLYTVNGSAMDWSYGDSGHAPILCFSNEIGATGFWPAFEERDQLFRENLWPMLYLMMAAGAYPEVSIDGATDLAGGLLEPGEDGALALVVSNLGVTEYLSPSEVTVRCDDPYVHLHEARRPVPTLAPMGSATLASLPLTVDAACPPGHPVRLTVAAGEIDHEVSVIVGEPTTVFAANFDDGDTSDWTLEGGPWGLTSTAYSAPYALTDSPQGQYADETSPTATIVGEHRATRLRFWHRYAIEEGWDFGHVQAAADGEPWQTIATFTGAQADWTEEVVDLTPYTDGAPVRVRFRLVTDWSVTEDGWSIDDVELRGVGTADDPPPAPPLLAPAGGVTVTGPVALTVGNVVDPDGDPVTYGFRVYGDADLTQLVASIDGVPAGDAEETGWTVSLPDGAYRWRAYAADAGQWGPLGAVRSFTVDAATAVDGVALDGPRLTVLGRGGGQAELRLALPRAGQVRIAVYDARGALIREVFDGRLGAGDRTLVWDGRDRSGRTAASGVYLVRAVTEDGPLAGRVVIVR